MNKLAKLFSVLGTACALSFAAAPSSAALVNAGGVLLDPDYTDGGEFDFISQFDFTQWYSASSTSAGVVDYGSGVGIGSVLATQDGSSGASGYFLSGVGEFYRINGLSKTNGDVFVPGGELTLAFGGIGLNKDGTFDISSAWAYVYVDVGGANYTPPASDQADVDAALDGNVWLELAFNTLAFTSGSVQNGVVSATFDILSGAGAGNFDPKTLTYTADARFTNGGASQVYSNGGNGSAYGNTIPEPGSMLLLGSALLGLGALRRRAA